MHQRHPAFLLLILTLLSACSPPPALTVSPAPMPVIGNVLVIDDFENPVTSWAPGTWPDFHDSSATRVVISEQHASRGSHALQMLFDEGNQPKAIFHLDRRLDISGTQTVAFDLYNEDGAARAVGIALRSGAEQQWQESRPAPVKPGENAVQFDLGASAYKTAATNWQYSATLQALNDVRQLAIVVYPNKSGSVYLDKLLATRAVESAQAKAAPLNTDSSSPYISLSAEAQNIDQDGRLDLDISTNVQVDNPFDPDQIAIDIHLNSPTGKPITIPAFFTQDFRPATHEPIWPQTWKARFTPTEEGTWTAHATLKAGTTNLTSQAINFAVAPAVSRGFVRVSASNPRYLAFDNGESFFPVGINLGWGHDDPLKDYERWFDALQQNGSNVARIWMASWSFGIEWSDSGLGRYRLDRAWLLDQVMQMAEQRGIYIILVLINHGAFNVTVNPEWDKNPYNAALGGPCQTPADFATNPQAIKLFKQRLRYIAARWSYSPNLLAWEWWNEVNFTPLADPNLLKPWLAEMTPYLHSVDPYHHLTSISYSDTMDPRISSLPELDTIQQHMYSSLDPRNSMPNAYTKLSVDGITKPNKPALFTEFGLDASGEHPTKFDIEGVQFHNGLWASTFSGFASAAMYWWWDSYIEPNNYWYHLKGLAGFLADQDVSSLKPAAAEVYTTTAQASALKRDDRALVWLRNSQYTVDAAISAHRNDLFFKGIKEENWRYELQTRSAVTVTLTGMQVGDYRVAWYDTRTAMMLSSSTTRTNDGNLVMTAPPFDRDIAARILRLSP
ncbi:MAG: cellulase family glycosylhydrolase [Chloroflexi bacterium]|nr:cellulase family glycosylhydrolase [Chloroflexota bacterium]MCL5274210.1 cellulase family glycosylhydrolase [Chloroflexota bacterium]